MTGLSTQTKTVNQRAPRITLCCIEFQAGCLAVCTLIYMQDSKSLGLLNLLGSTDLDAILCTSNPLASCGCVAVSDCFEGIAIFWLHFCSEKRLPESQKLIARPRTFPSTSKACSAGPTCRPLCLGAHVLHHRCDVDTDKRSCWVHRNDCSLLLEPRRWTGDSEFRRDHRSSHCAFSGGCEEACGAGKACRSIACGTGRPLWLGRCMLRWRRGHTFSMIDGANSGEGLVHGWHTKLIWYMCWLLQIWMKKASVAVWGCWWSTTWKQWVGHWHRHLHLLLGITISLHHVIVHQIFHAWHKFRSTWIHQWCRMTMLQQRVWR